MSSCSWNAGKTPRFRGRLESDSYGLPVNDSYEVLYEIPIELESSFWERLF